MNILLLSIAGALLLVQLLYYFAIYHRLYLHNRAAQQGEVHYASECPPLSVIICANEDSEHLRRNLPAVLEQDYPQFEVIVIDEGRHGETEDLLTLMEDKYRHLYHSFVPESSRYVSRKKLAITLGIKAAKYEWIVLTDADCRPVSDQWLRLMARNFTPHTQVVLGHSGYLPGKGWLQRCIDFDTLLQAMRYLGLALAGKPYMGIGRNLAYRKELFYRQKGFSAHLNLQRGDDDLFINQVATGSNTRVECASEAVIRRQPLLRAKEWREERIGHLSTARHYRGWHRQLVGGETLTRLAFHACWLAATIWGILHAHWLTVGIAPLLWIGRLGFQLPVVNLAAHTLGEPHRFYTTLPLLDLLQPLQSLGWRIGYALRRKSEFTRNANPTGSR